MRRGTLLALLVLVLIVVGCTASSQLPVAPVIVVSAADTSSNPLEDPGHR